MNIFFAAKSPNATNGEGGGGPLNGPASKDLHNDTTVSDISADITVDSVKDHTM